MKKYLLFILFSLLTIPAISQIAQNKAMFIFHFAKNMGWPEGDANKDFVITVIGDNDVAQAVEKLAVTRRVGNRNVIVNTAINAMGAEKSQLFYVSENKTKEIATLAQKYPKGSVIVSGKPGQVENGASYCLFINSEGKLNYEISVKNINLAGLSASTKVIELGNVVN